MTPIARLTPDQEALLPVVRDEWLAHGLSTEPADRATAEAGVKLAYERAGLAPPRIVVWLDSPLAGCIGSWMLGQVGGQVRGQVGGQVRGQVWGQVWDQVRDQVRGQVRDQVRGQVRDQVGDQVWGQVRWSLWGQHDAGWLAWVDAMTRIGVTCDARGLQDVARSAGWWWARQGAAVLTERPTTLRRDAQTRLHSGQGPAVAYPDGWGVYAWHGTRVPADLIETGWPLERVFREPNTEIRRCAVEVTAGRDGWAGIIRAAGWRQVGDTVPDPGNPGQVLRLWHVPAATSQRSRDGIGLYPQPVRLLQCVNGSVERDGSRREFGLTVPADINDPLHAAAWTYDIPTDEYALITARR